MNLNFFIRKRFFIIVMVMMLITACSNKDNNEVYVSITVGENQQNVSADYIYNHVDAMSFPSVVRSSGNKPVETEYKGIELLKLFNSLDMDLSNMQKITLNASDGYMIVLNIDEIYEPNNVYLTFERDKEYLKTKEKGGNGPFQLVIRKDPFSQRWCKHVIEILVE